MELSLLMAWRSNPLIFKWFKIQNSPLNWEEHLSFILESKGRLDYLVYLDERPIGHIALSNVSNEYPEISIMIGDTTLHKKGFGKEILSKFIIEQSKNGFSEFSAKIGKNNIASIKLFTNLGFVKVNEVNNEFEWDVFHFKRLKL